MAPSGPLADIGYSRYHQLPRLLPPFRHGWAGYGPLGGVSAGEDKSSGAKDPERRRPGPAGKACRLAQAGAGLSQGAPARPRGPGGNTRAIARPAAPPRFADRISAPHPGPLPLDLGASLEGAMRGAASAPSSGLRGGDLLRPFRRAEGGRGPAPAHDHTGMRFHHLRHQGCRSLVRGAQVPRRSRKGARAARALHGPLRHGAGRGGRALFRRSRHAKGRRGGRSTAASARRRFRATRRSPSIGPRAAIRCWRTAAPASSASTRSSRR